MAIYTYPHSRYQGFLFLSIADTIFFLVLHEYSSQLFDKQFPLYGRLPIPVPVYVSPNISLNYKHVIYGLS